MYYFESINHSPNISDADVNRKFIQIDSMIFYLNNII